MRSALLLALLVAYACGQALTTHPVQADCDTYCSQLMTKCPSQYNAWFATSAAMAPVNMTVCNNWCMWGVDAGSSGDQGGDSLACRLYHVGVAADDTSVHCKHAAPGGGGTCANDYDVYGTFCNLAINACDGVKTDTEVIYDSWDECVALSLLWSEGVGGTNYGTIPTGGATAIDDTADSFSCRFYHLRVATVLPSHCAHADWFGGNTCGSPCEAFCDMEASACVDDSDTSVSDSQYADRDSCVMTCNAFPNSDLAVAYDDTIKAGNSFDCRQYHLGVAFMGNSSVRAFHCPHTAWDGGEGVCGDATDYYCDLEASACPTNYASASTCATWAAYMPRVAGDQGSDSLDCRAYHATVANAKYMAGDTTNGDAHCGHSAEYSASGVCGTWCEAYCDAEAVICPFDDAADPPVVFKDQDDCETLCGRWPVGAESDQAGDSFYCRSYHQSVARTTPSHCAHTQDDGGDGVCGDLCDQFCHVVIDLACTATADVQYGGDADACATACADWAVGTRGEASHDTLSCRYYHAIAALDDPTTHCKHTAAVSAPCSNPADGSSAMSSTGPAETTPTGLSGSGAVPLSVFGAFVALIASILL